MTLAVYRLDAKSATDGCTNRLEPLFIVLKHCKGPLEGEFYIRMTLVRLDIATAWERMRDWQKRRKS